MCITLVLIASRAGGKATQPRSPRESQSVFSEDFNQNLQIVSSKLQVGKTD